MVSQSLPQGKKTIISDAVLTELHHKLSMYQVAELIKQQVVHDMNNLFFVLQANLDCSGFLDDPQNAELFDLLFSNMTKTMSRLLIEDEVTQSTDLVQVTQRFSLLMKSRYPDVSIQCVTTLEEAFVSVTENQYFLILLNLFTNACQAMEESKEKKLLIRLHACKRYAEKYCCLTVTDTGRGIPLELRVKIFESHFTTKSKGKGLGLNLVKATMDEIGGIIQVESEEHIGTVFHLHFPLSPKE